MRKFDQLINTKMKLYEAGVPMNQTNPMSGSSNLNQKKPQVGTNAPPDTGSGMGQQGQPNQQQNTQTQTTQTTQQPVFNPQEFETMVQSIVQHSKNPEAQKILQKYMNQPQ
jgi:hypothetical protein